MERLFWDNPETIDYLEKELHAGKVALAEGDTVLGLLADVSEKGYAQLDLIKNRSKKPYLILIGSPEKVFDFIEISPEKIIQTEKLMNICWPGPATLIFKAKSGVLEPAQSPEGNIAFRVPDHAGLLQLLSRFDALFSTSANSSGKPVPSSLDEVDGDIKGAVSCFVENDLGREGEDNLPSTIIDCTGDVLKVIRSGSFDVGRLQGLGL